MLTETSVQASDRRAVFVGVDIYEAAGSTMLPDLFQDDDGGWFEDPALLDTLVTEKLQAESETVGVEGWKWIEVALDLPYGYRHSLRSLSGDPAPMTDEVGAAHAKLLAEYRAVEEECAGQDDIPDEIDTRLALLETEMEEIETQTLIFDQTEIGRAGAFITLVRYGALAVYRGYTRPEDEPVEETAVHDGADPALRGRGMIVISPMAISVLTSGDHHHVEWPTDWRLVMELTAHTLSLREAIGRSPYAALTLLLSEARH